MSHFYKGEYRGIKYVVRPTGIRSFFLFRHIPYFVGDKAKIHLRIKKFDSTRDTRLNTLPINTRFPNGKIRPLYTHHNLPDSATKVTFESQAIPANGNLEYWLDTPEDGDSQKLVDLRGNWKDQIWLMIISALIGFGVGLLGQYLLNLIQGLAGK